MDSPFLAKPSIKYQNSFLAAIAEIQNEGKTNLFSVTMLENKLNLLALTNEANFEIFLKELELKSTDEVAALRGKVPSTTMWLIDKNDLGEQVFIGRLSIRHYLNETLRNSFGHLSYLIRPSARGLGYGSKILNLALEKCQQIITDLDQNQHRVLVSCKINNFLSRKVIEKNGGVLEKIVLVNNGLHQEMLFWIKL